MTGIDINEILRDHVTLDVECIDRIYLNGYIPNLQMPGQLVNFLYAGQDDRRTQGKKVFFDYSRQSVNASVILGSFVKDLSYEDV